MQKVTKVLISFICALLVSAFTITSIMLGETALVSVATDGTQGHANSFSSAISAEGRYIAFASSSSNLVPGDTNDLPDVFIHDRETGETTRVSVASDGTQAEGVAYGSSNPSISADGRYVAFKSYATNLVADDNNGKDDVFVHDMQTGDTTRVSVTSDGTESNDDSFEAFISADGRYVCFTSYADNLVTGDLNDDCDVFIHDMQTGETALISKTSNGTHGDDASFESSISADNRYVAFGSEATNLFPGDTNGSSDVLVLDRDTGAITRVSKATDGTPGDDDSNEATISGNGLFVVFKSYATNLVSGDNNSVRDIFVHALETGETTRVSVASDGTEANDKSGESAISADGRYVVFDSYASNLSPNDTNNNPDVFLHDRRTGVTQRLSLATDGTPVNLRSDVPSISADGRFVTFDSHASRLVPVDTNRYQDVFVRELLRGFSFLPLFVH
jgi:Tol biopolymer transport system component